MKVIYSPHLEFRLKFRQISALLPRRIFETSKEHYFDTATQKNIAIATVKYKNRMREMIVVYERHADVVVLVTVHPLKPLQKFHRIKLGRWQPI